MGVKAFSFFVAAAQLSAVAAAASRLTVDTTVGRLYGMVNGSAPDVAQFLGVPFAAPPVNELRFAPPQTKPAEGIIDATKIGPSCPQYPLTTKTDPSVYTFDSPWLQPYGPTSEDCLTLNVWSPLHAVNETDEPLPVLIWMFGGGFYEGGLLTNGFNPSNWIQRTQSHIVVAINYRVNIFGFPNAAGLAETQQNLNFGLLDQRFAVEWVRDNIAAFGGDPSKITLWGQSSGAASTDYYNYAWPDDPIVSGLIMHSGSVFATGSSADVEHTNFTFVAEHMGCGNLSPRAELACMRNVSADSIIQFYENYTLYSTGPTLKFTTIVDNVTKFEDYTARAYAGNYSKLPAIFGTNANEEASLVAWAGPQGPNMTYVHEETVTTQLCPANYNGHLRYNTSSLSFRYFNTANFSNTSPRPWEGAYHSSELPLLFGTYSEYGGPATPFQTAVASHWQDLYLAFMRDPVNALPAMGWPAYHPDGYAMMFAANGTVTSLLPMSTLETPCAGIPEPTIG
ncbi:chlorogenic acid esterase precursor [Aspergillus vadensis CBS 113365]|uniref:Carboxylic ester hydrolase n=1 Tax=Aspergillus vadensis (strain CBS 113365 / IMI 142717 / IBT 24658) TaxID=1448311 RepID=A0A319BJ39_ASPVC|nr:chlorogenic acid esterase precursor [Aspergillus vadensis CBS 113365]PYH72311.1 chlorogenic acid esterase precursor [Aspergillus vadensis CBS 113365]